MFGDISLSPAAGSATENPTAAHGPGNRETVSTIYSMIKTRTEFEPADVGER